MMEIQQVTQEDIPEITALAAECWKDYFTDTPDSLLQAACGMIVRNNYIEPDLSFKISEDGKIVAVIFAGTSDSASHPEDFYNHQLSVLDDAGREWHHCRRQAMFCFDYQC